ncbi:hypothetical protein NKI63_16295 [Mesorhizobium sp. M0410]|uniref:hypothetical protein n=1 Tax=Mesorhizobium sp. M0410 TaxID=2956943 RepID=UPI003338C5C3
MPALILALFATIIIVNLAMTVLATRSGHDRLRREELLRRQPGIQSQSGRGRAEAMLGWNGP